MFVDPCHLIFIFGLWPWPCILWPLVFDIDLDLCAVTLITTSDAFIALRVFFFSFFFLSVLVGSFQIIPSYGSSITYSGPSACSSESNTGRLAGLPSHFRISRIDQIPPLGREEWSLWLTRCRAWGVELSNASPRTVNQEYSLKKINEHVIGFNHQILHKWVKVCS